MILYNADCLEILKNIPEEKGMNKSKVEDKQLTIFEYINKIKDEKILLDN